MVEKAGLVEYPELGLGPGNQEEETVLGCGRGDRAPPSRRGWRQRRKQAAHKSVQTLSSHSLTEHTTEVAAVTQGARPESWLRLV